MTLAQNHTWCKFEKVPFYPAYILCLSLTSYDPEFSCIPLAMVRATCLTTNSTIHSTMRQNSYILHRDFLLNFVKKYLYKNSSLGSCAALLEAYFDHTSEGQLQRESHRIQNLGFDVQKFLPCICMAHPCRDSSAAFALAWTSCYGYDELSSAWRHGYTVI